MRTEQGERAGRRVAAQLPQGAEMKDGDLSFRPASPAGFCDNLAKEREGEAHRWTRSPGPWRLENPHSARSLIPWLGGTRDPPASPCLPPPQVLSEGGRLTRVILVREGARRPCPAVLADGLFLCFDTCAYCLMHLSLIYRPIKDSAFFKPPELLPSPPSSLRGGNGGLECGAETVLSPLPAPAAPPGPYHTPLQKRSFDEASAGLRSLPTA